MNSFHIPNLLSEVDLNEHGPAVFKRWHIQRYVEAQIWRKMPNKLKEAGLKDVK